MYFLSPSASDIACRSRRIMSNMSTRGCFNIPCVFILAITCKTHFSTLLDHTDLISDERCKQLHHKARQRCADNFRYKIFVRMFDHFEASDCAEKYKTMRMNRNEYDLTRIDCLQPYDRLRDSVRVAPACRLHCPC